MKENREPNGINVIGKRSRKEKNMAERRKGRQQRAE